MRALMIGGELKWAHKVVEKLNRMSQGDPLVTEMTHQPMNKRRKWKRLSRKVELVIVLKDTVSHKLRDWARHECKVNGVLFLEIPQNISRAARVVDRMRSHTRHFSKKVGDK